MPRDPAFERRQSSTKLTTFLGLFSLGLGAAELLAGRKIARAVGLQGREGVVRAFGVREISAGVGVLAAPTRPEPIWARIAGDVLDVGVLTSGLGARDRDGRKGALVALGAVAAITALDALAARALRG